MERRKMIMMLSSPGTTHLQKKLRLLLFFLGDNVLFLKWKFIWDCCEVWKGKEGTLTGKLGISVVSQFSFNLGGRPVAWKTGRVTSRFLKWHKYKKAGMSKIVDFFSKATKLPKKLFAIYLSLLDVGVNPSIVGSGLFQIKHFARTLAYCRLA